MIAKCPNCGAMLECEQAPGETVDCAGCGQSFEARPIVKPPPTLDDIQHRAANAGLNTAVGKLPPAHLRNPKPWKDDQRLAMLFVVFGVAAPILFVALDKMVFAYAVASLAWGVMFIWGFGLLRACAYRLHHIEELLARRG